MRLSVIVPATDVPPSLRRCVDAVVEAASGDDEIIVVDSPPFASPAVARNDGAMRAEGDVLVFVDADVVVRADVLERIRAAFTADEELVALFGSYDADPEVTTTVSMFRNLLHHFVHQGGRGPVSSFWTGIGAIRRTAFVDAGGFDEELSWVEDIELGLRLSAIGARIELDPDLQGTHLKAWTLRSMVETDFARRGVPWVRLLIERRVLPPALNLRWEHRWSTLAALAAAAGVATRNPRLCGTATLALLALNTPFYTLLARRLGARGLAAGIPLHVIHLLTAAAAVPAGVVMHVIATREKPANRAPTDPV